jgi:RimK family alpha-L-glutamate ligase
MRFAIIARRRTPTNEAIAAVDVLGARWELMTPEQALDCLVAGDVALGRLDVLPTLDGMDDGLWALGALAARGVVVLNDPPALLAAHDKLLTARLLRRAGVPHPRTWHVRDGRPAPVPKLPVVIKPRFGSWGSEVRRCDDDGQLDAALSAARDAAWFKRHGALVQELVTPCGYDLRIVVAEGHVVGSVFRIAAPGEWRTNIALGGVRRSVVQPPRDASTIAIAAAAATGASLVGVDLLPDGESWTVLELNGAVELTHEYAPWGDVFSEIAVLLGRVAQDRLAGRAHVAADIA